MDRRIGTAVPGLFGAETTSSVPTVRSSAIRDVAATPTYDVVGIGNALVDVIAHADDAFLGEHDLVKGSMTLVDTDRAVELYRALGSAVEMSGGSAANTMCGVASLRRHVPPTSARSATTSSAGCSVTTAAPSACSSARAR